MKTRRDTFEKALGLLAHPFSLAAAALLLLNDLVLRTTWPSWWTGKLGDLAWLGFTPLVFAAGLAWLVPARNPHQHEHWTIRLALFGTALGFILVKIIPPVNLLATRILAKFLSATPSLTLDPWDLLALPALALPAWLWYAHSRPSPDLLREAKKSVWASALPAAPAVERGWLALPFVALLLLADAAAPDMGFSCFLRQDGKIYAEAGYQSYVSEDGGLSWADLPPGQPLTCVSVVTTVDGWQQAPGPREGELYRYRPDEEIQHSTDSGATWQTVRSLEPISEPERYFLMKTRAGNPFYSPGPLDAVGDPASGSMIFAMGQQGALVHTAQGVWLWSYGGAYQNLEGFPGLEAFTELLGGVMYMAVGLALLIFSSLALRWTRHPVRYVVLALAWLGWLAVDLIFPPSIASGYTLAITSIGMAAVALLAVPLAIEQAIRLVKRAPKRIFLLAVLGLVAALGYFLPYALWLYSVLGSFSLATGAGLLAPAAVLAAGFALLRKN